MFSDKAMHTLHLNWRLLLNFVAFKNSPQQIKSHTKILCGTVCNSMVIFLSHLYNNWSKSEPLFFLFAQEQSFLTKVWWAFVCTKVMMWRYMIVWLIAVSHAWTYLINGILGWSISA